MPTVAIVHAAEDALPARALAEKLRAARLTVVLEKPPGEELRNAGKSANVAIALWSPRSVSQPALAEDVAFLRGKTKLIHACMQNAAAPDAFRSDKTVNLTGWRGEDEFPAWRELAKLVTDKAGVAPLPAPAPRPASGFFQPGLVDHAAVAAANQRAPQRPGQQRASSQASRPQQAQRAAQAPRTASPQRAPQAPRESSGGGGGRGLMIGAIVFVVVALAGGGGYWFWSQSQGAQTTSAVWDSLDRNDADALRAFISGDPGDHREDAQQALVELEERSFEAASDSDTIDAFEGFLNEFPESQHALAARGRIAELQTMTPAPADSTLVPADTAVDPDLVPPGAADTSGGPATLTPPTETPPSEEPAGPTN